MPLISNKRCHFIWLFPSYVQHTLIIWFHLAFMLSHHFAAKMHFRSFMVVDEEDRAVTARKCPKMILIETSFTEDKKHLVLRVEGKEDLYIPLDQQGTRIESRWETTCHNICRNFVTFLSVVLTLSRKSLLWM